MIDVERLLDNAACASQERKLLRDDNNCETALREAVRLNVVEPMQKTLDTLQSTLQAHARENERLREALESARSMLVDLRDKHLNHTAAVVRAIVQHRIEAADAALSQMEDKT
jgi:allophanate hydrolase subunit 1